MSTSQAAPATQLLSTDTTGTFTFGQRLGLVFVAMMACISFLAVASLLLLFFTRALRDAYRRQLEWPSAIYAFFVTLLFFDMIGAFGSIMDIKWVHLAGVVEGPYCNAQGFFKQLGDTGGALSNLALSIQTFRLLVWRTRLKPTPSQLILIPLGLIWFFLLCITIIPWLVLHSRHQTYYGNTRWWCWITRDNLALGIALEYAWFWTSALISIILYVPLATVLYRRNRIRHEELTLGPHSISPENAVQKAALSMLFYPLIYTITVLPISICRFLQFRGKQIPFEWTAFAAVVLASSGMLNIILYAITRPSLVGIQRRRRSGIQNQRMTFNLGTQLEDVPKSPNSTRKSESERPNEL